MASSSVAWGIEVGAGAIKAIKLSADGDGVKCLDFAVIPHARPTSAPGTDFNEVVALSLSQLTSQFDLTGATIAVSVPGHAGFARFAKLPPVDPKKVPDIVKFEAMQQIPFPLEQVEWDFQTFVAPDSPDVEVGIFAITRERIMERLAMLEVGGLTPDVVTLSPLAAFNALAFDLQMSDKDTGTVIVDIGTTSTDLVVSEAGRVWVRTFPIGGHQFTEALVNAYQLRYEKADKLKREVDESDPKSRQIFQALRPVFQDLAQDVQRSIGYYTSLHKDAKLGRVIGVGSTFRTPGLRKYLKQQLSLEVYRVEEFKRCSFEGERAAQFKEASLELCTAYGLALQGLGLNTISGNLMPVPVLRDAMWKRKVKWFAAAACVGVVAGGAMFVRPFIDSTAVASKSPDPSIQQAISAADSARQRAEEAKVIGQAEPDLRASALVGLLDRRDFYGRFLGDVSEMLKFSDGVARSQGDATIKALGDTPAFTIRELSTEYLKPTAADAAAGDPSMMGGEAGQGQGEVAAGAGGFGESIGGSPVGSAPGADPHIRVTLRLSTLHPDPQRFVVRSAMEWLNKNAKRDGVPYQFQIPRTGAWSVESTTKVGPDGQASPAGGAGGAGAAGGANAGENAGGGDRIMIGGGEGGGRRGGRGGAMATGGGGGGGGMIGGGGGGGGAQPGSSGGGADLGAVDGLAPLSELLPKLPTDAQQSVILVSFDVILAPVKKDAEAGAETGAEVKQ